MKIRCPHCRNPVDIVDEESALSDVDCPSCGTQFSFLGDSEETQSLQVSGAKRLGHFELDSLLGQGHFGQVWRALDTELERTVAIKIPRRTQFEGSDAELFLREAAAAAQLKHPNIVSVHEIGREDKTVYIVSELIDGVDLRDQLTAGTPAVKEAVQLCIKIADALHHAHEAGIVHRDLKPSNILIDANGEPHITDFGLAKREAAEITMTADGVVLGTPTYMSPEQALGDANRADRRSDTYSLGVILFEMLTGGRPFRGNARMLMHQVIHDEPPALRKFNNNIPRDLETICLKCLQKRPDRRYETTHAVAADLRRFLDGRPIAARPVPVAEHVWRWCKRNPVVSSLSAALVVALLFGMAGVTWQWSRAAASAADEAVARKEAEKAKLAAVNEAQRASRSEAETREARQQTRRYLYVAHINLVQEAWHAGAALRMQELLLRCLPQSPDEADLRGFDWFYWWRVADRFEKTFVHGGHVHCVALSPNGQTLVSGGQERDLLLWNIATGEIEQRLQGHTKSIRAVAFDPRGGRVVSASDDGVVRLWDLADAEQATVLGNHGRPVLSVAFSHDGKTVASAGRDSTVRLWEPESAESLGALDGHVGPVMSLLFSPDGETLASAGKDGKVILWDMKTQKQTANLDGHRSGVYAVAFSPNGRKLAGGLYTGAIKLWDREDDSEATLSGHVGIVGSLAFSPDGETLASTSVDGTARLWNVATAEAFETVHEHTLSAGSLAFSSDGHQIASGSGDGTVKIWSSQTDGPRSVLPDEADRVEAVAFIDDRELASAGSDATVTLRDVQSGDVRLVLRGHTGDIFSIAVDPRGRRLASASNDGSARLWDAYSGRQLKQFDGHKTGVLSVAFSPDGETLVTGGVDRTAIVWSLSTGDVVKILEGHAGGVRGVAVSADSQLIATASVDGEVRLWDRASGDVTLTLTAHAGGARAVAFSPDGSILATAGADRVVKLWDVNSGELKHALEGHAAAVASVTFSPDGKTIVSSSADRTIKTWDVSTSEATTTFTGHARQVLDVAFSPNSRTLASAGMDGTIRLWRASPEVPTRSGLPLTR